MQSIDFTVKPGIRYQASQCNQALSAIENKTMTPSDLKYQYETAKPDGYFFTRKSMQFFGDTMKNYGICRFTHNGRNYAELRRKRPVKHGMQGSHYFDLETLDSSTTDPRDTLEEVAA